MLHCICTNAQTDGIITNPEGTPKTYDMSTCQMARTETYDYSGIKTDVVFSDDGKTAYFQDIVTAFGFGTWVAGDVVGDSIFIKCGQQIHHQDETENMQAIDVYINAGKMRNGEFVVTDNKYIKMAIDKDGTISTAKDEGVIATDQYGDLLGKNYAYLLRPFNIETDTVIPPADIASTQYCLNYKDYFGNEIYRLVNLKADEANKTFYVQGVAQQYAPESWIKGELKGDSVYFAKRQYQGIAESQFLDFFYPGHADYTQTNNYALDEHLAFFYDNDKKEFFSEGSALEMIGDKILLEAYDQPSLKPYTPHAAMPATPVMRDYSDYWYNGFIVLRFNISPTDENGYYIDPEGLKWRLIVDGKPYTFNKDTYKFLDADTETFDWGFADNVDIVFEACGLYNIWFYDDCEEIAAECTYTYNGETHTATSQPMRVKNTSGIDRTEADTKEAVRTVYHDLSGRAVKNPAKGIYIKTVTHADGSQTTSKVNIK